MRALLPLRRPLGHLLILASLALPASAAAIDRAAYANAVRLVERLYLHPERVTPHQMLHAAAQGLATEVDWLMVESSGSDVALRHGDGTPVGAVSVGSWEGLPAALQELETVVAGSGYGTGDVDVRLVLLQGMTDALDRYSRVMHGDPKERFERRLSGQYEGIGATLGRRDGRLVVTDIVEEGPAEEGGLRTGDLIVRIDDRSTTNMPVADAVRLVLGEQGTQVVLTIERDGEPRTLALTRARVTEPNVRSRVLDDGVGYVHITHISQRTVENLQRAMQRLAEQGGLQRGLVVDLRGNTGGSMKEAARAADMFLDDGLLLRTIGHDGGKVQNLQAEMQAEASGDEPQIPVVIVVDDRTASGSEIFAGALLELERAALVGTRTYGKGTVQKIYNIDPEAQFKLTVAQYVLANDRRIADEGLVPDTVIGRIELDGNGVRYRDYDEGDQRTPFERILPHVVEKEGWRGQAAEHVDLPVEVARRAVLGSTAPTRAATLAALQQVEGQVRAEQEARLVEALEARGIDWSPAPEEGTFAETRVTLRAAPDPDRVDVYAVEAVVDNLDDEPLHRVLVELSCPSLYAWDGLVVPVGRVEPGAQGTGTVHVPLPPGVDLREDPVSVRVRAHQRPPRNVGDQVLTARSSTTPSIAVSARLVPHQGEDGRSLHRAEVTVQNLGAHLITGVQARFAYPRDLDVELVDLRAGIPLLAARAQQRLDLTLALGASPPDRLPLDLEIESERYRTLAQWPLTLPLDGATVALQAPEIRPRTRAVSAPSGTFALPLVVTDEGRIDHVVVFANGHKVAWAPGRKGSVELRPEIELLPGVNRVLVVAEDEHRLRTRKWLYLRGEPPTGVSGAPSSDSEGASVDASDD